jgi:hypothetical protein
MRAVGVPEPPPADRRPAGQALRAPVQVMDGNYQRMDGVCPWWDAVKAEDYHYSCVLLRSQLCCGGMVRRSGVAGVAVEDALELWASSLREVKRRLRPLFSQERVAVSAGLFLDGLFGPERR